MRKTSNRKIKYSGARLSPGQLQSILLGPELAYVMLSGSDGANIAQVQALLGLFNLGSTLTTNTPNYKALNEAIISAQHLVSELKTTNGQKYVITEDSHKKIVSCAVGGIHELLRKCDIAVLSRAIIYINRSFAGQTKASIIPWDTVTTDTS